MFKDPEENFFLENKDGCLPCSRFFIFFGMLRKILICLLTVQWSFGQKFVTVDDETLEFIPDAVYRVYENGKPAFSKTCDNSRATEITPVFAYDSIVFEKFGYQRKSIVKDSVKAEQIVFMVPKTFLLDEMVLMRSSKKDTLLGEKNKFFRKRNRPMEDHLCYGLWLANPYGKEIHPKSFRFFTDKITYKTAYKIHFYIGDRSQSPYGLEIPIELFRSETRYLMPGEKGMVSYDLLPTDFVLPLEGVLASVELVHYFDEDGNYAFPEPGDRTKIRFQFSARTDYFARTADLYTKVESIGLANINARINHDFAILFFKKPHKSNLTAPAYFLEVTP